MTLVMLDETGAQVVARVPEGDARREHVLRDMIAAHPDMLPVHEIDPSFGRLFTVARELSVPGVGFIDVLLADERGRLVVVECKLWRNPQARREVVGQILDYARELARYAYDDLQRQVSVASRRQGNVLYELAREAGSVMDEAAFVDRVSRDLAAGRFLLLVVGDGITEGTRRIGEYLRAQPGLAFDFGLIEMAEYRYADAGGTERTVVQPRVLARTAVIERHVIRAEAPGIVVDDLIAPVPAEPRGRAATSQGGSGTSTGGSDAAAHWRAFLDRFVAETRFDDPGQPSPRWGGIGWLKLPLPHGLYANVYRSQTLGQIGVEVRLTGAEGATAYADLESERDSIAAEFTAAGLPSPERQQESGPKVLLTLPSPQPWNAGAEDAQRDWLGRVANQMVNSLRPRLQRLGQEIAV